MAGNREYLRTAGIGDTQILKCLAAVLHDPGDRGKRLSVVDRGRAAEHAVTGRERRLETRLTLLAFDRLDQRGLFAADISAIAMNGIKIKTEIGTEQLLADEACLASLCQRLLESLVIFPDLAMNIVVTDACTQRIGGNRHALDQLVRVVTDDVAVLECAGLTLVRIADQIFDAVIVTRHETPFETSRKTCTATSAQTGELDLTDDVGGLHFFRHDTLQLFVTAQLDIGFQAVGPGFGDGSETDQCLLLQVMGQRLHYSSPSRISSTLAGVSDSCILVLFTWNSGAPPQAPMHSPSFSVNLPSGVVSLKPIPSLHCR